MKKILFITSILIWIPISEILSQPVSLKAYNKRVELITYLRQLEPIVKNYPGNDTEGKPVTTMYAEEGKEGHRIKRYDEIKRIYQEALQYYFESNFVASYRRFLEAQIAIEKLTEEISQLYVLRAEEMMKVAMERKNPNDPLDKTVVDISIEYGRNSNVLKEMKTDRESPFLRRMYEPKEFRYVINKYGIEKNVEMGYKFLGMAKTARIEALAVEKHLEKHQTMNPEKRKYRIDKYFGAISLCRDSKANASNIFKLKYPYDNYFLQRSDAKQESWLDMEDNVVEGKVVKLEGVTYNFDKNPYIKKDHRLQAAFDERIPAEFRLDYADTKSRVYEKDTDAQLFLKYDKPRRDELGVPKRTEVKKDEPTQEPAPSTPAKNP
jgi:hypothetical protein